MTRYARDWKDLPPRRYHDHGHPHNWKAKEALSLGQLQQTVAKKPRRQKKNEDRPELGDDQWNSKVSLSYIQCLWLVEGNNYQF